MKMLPFALLLSGCIIYDHTGKCRECGWESTDSGTPGDSNDPGDSSGEDSDVDPEEASFTLTPSEGLIGSVFITSLTAENFDLSTVAETSFYGEVELLATQNRGDEILLTVSIPADAAVGSADLLLVMEDGSARMLEDILSLVTELSEDPAGTNGEDPNGNGGSGNGSGNGSGEDSGPCD